MPLTGIRTGDWLPIVELTVSTAIYASGDLMSQAVKIPEACKENGTTQILTVTVIDYDDQGANLDLIFFSEDPGELGDLNAGMAISDGKAALIQGHITVNSWLDIGAQRIGSPGTAKTVGVRPTDGGTSIWVAARSGGTGTYPTGKLTVVFDLLRG